MKKLGGGLEIGPTQAARVEELASRLETFRASYYAGRPTVSDDAYDALEEELRALAPAHPALARVGTAMLSEAWEKAQHEIPMGSLNKVTNAEQFGDWLKRCDELLAKQDEPSIRTGLFVTEKLDGISIELIYRDGVFSDAITRGDGEIGGGSPPMSLECGGCLLGSAIVGASPFGARSLSASATWRDHFPDYANARNAAAGLRGVWTGRGPST